MSLVTLIYEYIFACQNSNNVGTLHAIISLIITCIDQINHPDDRSLIIIRFIQEDLVTYWHSNSTLLKAEEKITYIHLCNSSARTLTSKADTSTQAQHSSLELITIPNLVEHFLLAICTPCLAEWRCGGGDEAGSGGIGGSPYRVCVAGVVGP